MKLKLFGYLFLVIFFFNGCSVQDTPLSLFNSEKSISFEQINDKLSGVLPIQKKTSFGSVNFRRAVLVATQSIDRVALSIAFSMTSFEIPEGIDGVLNLSAGLRYEPSNKKIYLTQLTPIGYQFSNKSLSEYVSKSALSAMNVLAMKELEDIEIYQMEKSFSAKFIKSIAVDRGRIVVKYGF
jgi:hypothetical protein